MKKRFLSLLLVGILTVTMLAGCGTKNETTKEDTKVSSNENTDAENNTAEAEAPTKIVLESLYFDAQPKDLKAVEDEINKITIPAINVQVELYPLGFMDASSQVSLMISSGSQLDLIVNMLRPDYLSLVNKSMLLSLNDLYEKYGTDIKANATNAVPGGYVGDQLYGIPSIEKYGRTYGLIMKKEVTDAIGWTKFEDLTLDDLSGVLAQAKTKFPDKSLIHITGGGNNVANFEYFYPIDYLGADAACGGIMGIGPNTNDKIVNVFATEEYATYCKTMREWFLAGYFNADCATSTDTAQSGITAGTAEAYFLNTELDMVPSQAASNNCEMVSLNTRGHYLTQGDINNQTWSIPITCKEPEAAMKLLNMMWGNKDLINLIYYGIEGTDYKLDDQGRVSFIDGQTAQTVGYRQWFGLYGDTTQRLTADNLPADFHDQLVAYNNELGTDKLSKYLGYSFNPDEMKTQYSAISDAIKTYRTALECGSVDPDEVLPKFLDALKAAGMDDVIAKNQANLDAWLANK